MPVPASYNDITEDSSLRDHVGTVWYDRKFFVPGSWSDNKRVWIRFGSVHYEAHVVRLTNAQYSLIIWNKQENNVSNIIPPIHSG